MVEPTELAEPEPESGPAPQPAPLPPATTTSPTHSRPLYAPRKRNQKRGHKPHNPSLAAATPVTPEKRYLTTDTPTPFFFIRHRHRPLPSTTTTTTTTTSHPSKRSRTRHSQHLPPPPLQKNHPTRKSKPKKMLTASGAFDIDRLYVLCARAKMRAKTGEMTTVVEEGRRWLGKNLRVGKMG
ncbi:hypothetical protein BDZ91DRAFT_730738 [Kalaharituber pfeilii]|nr:hypothetical protein BDZ91DRAFT_730738 [Kalaharituber pfeilii]